MSVKARFLDSVVHMLDVTAPYEQRLITCWVLAFCMCVIVYEALPGNANETLINLSYSTLWIAGGFHIAKGVAHIFASKKVDPHATS